MTSSSSPGISLKQEGISYGAGADVPMVIANIVRGGPGLGNIAPAQSDYFQATRGGGHGDYHSIVLAPKNVQECADLTGLAFDLADKYRMPTTILADGMLGQMMEGVVFQPEKSLQELPSRSWTAGKMPERAMNNGRRKARHITSINLNPVELETITKARFVRYETVKANETRYEDIGCADADLVLVAYGTSARVCLGARMLAEKEGVKLGIFRPITVWPFPYTALAELAAKGKTFLTVEMSLGQLVEDVKLSVFEAVSTKGLSAPGKVHFFGRSGGIIPTEEEVFSEAKRILGK
jgi:2-oxoglutarate ferredoxin oxidoreductase subunit alpha